MDSGIKSERDAMNAQRYAEQALITAASEHGFSWTLFRPTLVYDGKYDKNVASLAGFIARFGFFPIIGSAKGLRQPLHADDLAQACVGVLNNPSTYMKSYNLGGGQVLSYREMIEQIFRTLEKRPKIIAIPYWLYRAGISMVRFYPRYRHFNTEMAKEWRLI